MFAPHIHRTGRSGGKLIPSGPVEVDWTHPLARGLLSLYLPGLSGVDLCWLGGTLAAASGSTPVSGLTRHGPAAMGGSSGSRAMTAPAGNLQSKLSTAGSILWVGDNPSSGSDHSVNFFGYAPNQGNVAPWHYVAIGYFFGAFSFMFPNVDNSDVVGFNYAASTPSAGLIASAAFTVNVGTNTSVVGYMNGAQSFNTTGARSAALVYTGAPTIEVHSPGSRFSGANTNLGALWGRALSNDEQVALHGGELFELLRPARRSLFRSVAVVGGGVSRALTPNAATATTTQAGALARSRALVPNAAAASTTQAAALARSRALAGTGAASSSQAAALNAIRALAIAGTANTTQAGALTRTRQLTTAAGTASTTQAASLARIRALQAAGTAASSQAAVLNATRALAPAGTAASSQAATLGRSRALAGAATSVTTQAATLGRFTQGQLAGAANAATTQTATLHAMRAMVAGGLAVSGQTATLGRLRALLPVPATAASGQAGTARRSRALTPLPATAGSGQGAAQNAVRRLVMAGGALTTQAAAMGRRRPLLAAGTAVSSQTGHISAGAYPAPAQIPAHHTIVIPLDTRTVTVPLDTRTILIP